MWDSLNKNKKYSLCNIINKTQYLPMSQIKHNIMYQVYYHKNNQQMSLASSMSSSSSLSSHVRRSYVEKIIILDMYE